MEGVTCSQGKPNIMFGTCYYSEGNYTTNSPYHTNLLNAFSNLTSLSSVNTFSNFTMGSDENKIYALYNCRYDLTLETCHDCVAEASEKLIQRCISKEGIVYYEECILRYANRRIFSMMELSEPYDFGCGVIGVPDEGEMSEIIEPMFKGLINEATSENSSRYFAVGEKSYYKYQKVYGLVQCTPDITREECKDCLTNAVNVSAGCANSGKLIGVLSGPSCQIRYNFTPFYNLSSALPPPGLQPRLSTSQGDPSLTLMGKFTILFPILSFLLNVFSF